MIDFNLTLPACSFKEIRGSFYPNDVKVNPKYADKVVIVRTNASTF